MGVVESSGVAFTTFQLKGATYQWWRAYGLGSPSKAASLTSTQFSEMFMKEFVPQRLRDVQRAKIEQLRQGAMNISEYAVRFIDFSRHAPTFVFTIRERVRQFIEGLNPGIRFSMARELEMDIPYQQVVEIVMRLEVTANNGRGYVSRPFHSSLPASSSITDTPRPQVSHYAPPLSSAPSAQGAFSGQSCRSGLSRFQQPCPPRAFFECGDTSHMIRDFPKLRKGCTSTDYPGPTYSTGPSGFSSRG
ncbi:uncharacterized protein [Nicotiana tomentosiformis]|uniref:uncharacterized protein n=1 Tax=Nicotiana tomentosiformis TaxID=4098 RepID=UPI00388C8C88